MFQPEARLSRVRYPSHPASLARISRVARELPHEAWDEFFDAVKTFFTHQGWANYEPPGQMVEAAIEHGLAVVAAGVAPIPLSFRERDALDGQRRPPADRHVTASLVAARSMRVRRARGRL